MSLLESARWRQMREEWRGNQRLRWGVAAIAAILFAYVLVVLADWRRDLHDEYQQRTQQLYKMAALAGQEHWSVRAQAAMNVRKSLQAEIPKAATIGLAQAEVQAAMRQILNAFGPNMASESRPPAQVRSQPGLWRVPVTIRGMLTQVQLMEVLRRIEGSDRLFVVDELQVAFVQGQPNVTLTAVALYRVDAKGGSRATP